MTAKEKALELANKFIRKSVFDMTDEELKEKRQEGKSFAIICVDEILNNDGFTRHDNSLTEFWRDVKREIDAL